MEARHQRLLPIKYCGETKDGSVEERKKLWAAVFWGSCGEKTKRRYGLTGWREESILEQ